MSVSFNFGDIVVVEDCLIGVVVKSWADDTHDVYVRSFNSIKEYKANDIKRYIYDKELEESK